MESEDAKQHVESLHRQIRVRKMTIKVIVRNCEERGSGADLTLRIKEVGLINGEVTEQEDVSVLAPQESREFNVYSARSISLEASVRP